MRSLLDKESTWRTRLEQDFDVRDYMFDTQLKHLTVPADILLEGAGSALHMALRTIATRFQQRPVAGVLLLSDGNATDIATANDFDFPIYPLVDEDSTKIKDIRIGTMSVTQTNFEASPMTVDATVSSEGFDGQEITARIVNDQGTKIQELSARADGDKPLDFRFRFRPEKAGLSFQRLEVFLTQAEQTFQQDDPGAELTLANNSRWITANRGGGRRPWTRPPAGTWCWSRTAPTPAPATPTSSFPMLCR